MAMADTTPSKVYDIAEKLGYEGARTQSSAKAVYACADALGFVGPHARRITDALSDLKTVVGGGGGGVDLGPLASVGMVYNEPTVGSSQSPSGGVSEVRIGNALAVSSGGAGIMSPAYAAGLTLSTVPSPAEDVVCSFYVVTMDNNTGKYATVTAWDGTSTKRETTLYSGAAWVWDFVMPELEQGELLYYWYHEESGSF